MKNSFVFLTVIGSIFAIAFFVYKGAHNGLVNSERQVIAQWSNVEKQYQSRANLISNLVDTVKAYAESEQNTLGNVIEAHAKAIQVIVDPTFLNEHTMAQFLQVQNELDSAISQLFTSIETYPELKISQNLLNLQTQLGHIENRIVMECTYFDEASKEYNQLIHAFPGNIVANMGNFIKKPYFNLQKGVNKTL